MEEKNGKADTQDKPRAPHFGSVAEALAAIGWLGSLGGQVWVVVAWTSSESSIVLAPAEYAAISAILIPLLVGTTAFWILRLRKRFGSVALFTELVDEIEDAKEEITRCWLYRRENCEDDHRVADQEVEYMVALAWKLEKWCKIPAPPTPMTIREWKIWRRYLEQLSWFSHVGELKPARKVWPELKKRLEAEDTS